MDYSEAYNAGIKLKELRDRLVNKAKQAYEYNESLSAAEEFMVEIVDLTYNYCYHDMGRSALDTHYEITGETYEDLKLKMGF